MVQRSEQADRVLDLAWAEAEGFGHRYLGPEHLVLGVLATAASRTSRVLEAHGVVDLPAGREALGRLADRGVVPAPRPSDAEPRRSRHRPADDSTQHRAGLWLRGGVGDPGGDPGSPPWGWAGAAGPAG